MLTDQLLLIKEELHDLEGVFLGMVALAAETVEHLIGVPLLTNSNSTQSLRDFVTEMTFV